MKTDREQAKTKIAEMKANFKEDIKKIKDENKKVSVEKIIDTIQSLNTKLIDY
jgi:F0F1-type ATP synthase membrane subunit b/b'